MGLIGDGGKDELDFLYSEVVSGQKRKQKSKGFRFVLAFFVVVAGVLTVFGVVNALVLNQKLQLVSLNMTLNRTVEVSRDVLVEVPCKLEVVEKGMERPAIEPCYEVKIVTENVTTFWNVSVQEFRTSDCKWVVDSKEWCFWDKTRVAFVCKNLLRCDGLARVEPGCEFKMVRERVSDGCTPLIQSLSKTYPDEYKESYAEALSRKTGSATSVAVLE